MKALRLIAFTHIHGDPSLNKEGLTERNPTQTLPSRSLQTGEPSKGLEKRTESLRATKKLRERGCWGRSLSFLDLSHKEPGHGVSVLGLRSHLAERGETSTQPAVHWLGELRQATSVPFTSLHLCN